MINGRDIFVDNHRVRRRYTKTMIRLLFLIHRYVGIAIGLVMALWCLSGVVMMYVQYPALSEGQQRSALDTLDITRCCLFPQEESLTGFEVQSFQIEMLAGRPVVRLFSESGAVHTVDLASGDYLAQPSPEEIQSAAETFKTQLGITGELTTYQGQLERDQWTVYASYHRYRP